MLVEPSDNHDNYILNCDHCGFEEDTGVGTYAEVIRFIHESADIDTGEKWHKRRFDEEWKFFCCKDCLEDFK